MTRPSHFPRGFAGISARDVHLSDGTRLRLVESGDAKAPPVLLVHGFGASAYQWRFLFASLAEAGYHVLGPDLPGHGFSQLTFPDGEYTREHFARRVMLLLDALQIERAPVIGHSMGGAIVAELAWRFPERVERLALMSAAGLGQVPWRARLMTAIPDVLAPHAKPFVSREAARLVLRDVYGPDATWTVRDEDELLAPYAQAEIFRAMLRTLKEFDFTLHPPERLAQLPAGTLVLFGDADKVVRPADLDARVAAIPGSRLVWLPRVGHLPHVEAAAQVGALLTEFLRAPRVAPAVEAH